MALESRRVGSARALRVCLLPLLALSRASARLNPGAEWTHEALRGGRTLQQASDCTTTVQDAATLAAAVRAAPAEARHVVCLGALQDGFAPVYLFLWMTAAKSRFALGDLVLMCC